MGMQDQSALTRERRQSTTGSVEGGASEAELKTRKSCRCYLQSEANGQLVKVSTEGGLVQGWQEYS